jgi:hypothetical protein
MVFPLPLAADQVTVARLAPAEELTLPGAEGGGHDDGRSFP